ncbi:c-type cytochrome [Spiribacter salinus]|uniref:Cytochrome c n=1 Tax=Spiribacter salinus TaxID=1335746 RepID=A0A540VW11_9GAMM|nr:cytochrome c [Spiribacter salinus]MBY5267837.1 cytochrome C [Spiribacter salinus]MDR9413436.1 cytochrome c [Spiribacter sp.]MDR9454270.1 cytochrome c [Spiribacter sp.]TQF00955.1 MAG: cytochrome c [Spiribacter salinus]
MMRVIQNALVMIAMLMAGTVVAQPIGDREAGREKSASCVACHGEVGVSSNPEWPNLAGQHPDYIVHALQAYKSGDRQNALMNGQAADLSTEDMRDLAAYYSSQDAEVYTPARTSR